MAVVETVIAYRYMPSAVLSTSLIGMCRLVNVRHLTERVVKVRQDGGQCYQCPSCLLYTLVYK